MKLRIRAALAACVVSTTVAFAQAPVLPVDAKKLTGQEIVALYHGKQAAFINYTKKVTLTGSTFYDFDRKRAWGFYVWDGKDKGLFKAPIEIKEDRFCYKPDDAKKICVSVHVSDADIYEVDAKGGRAVSKRISFRCANEPAGGRGEGNRRKSGGVVERQAGKCRDI